MKKLVLILFIFLNSLFSASLQELLNTHSNQKFVPYGSTKCFGNNSNLDNKILNTELQYKNGIVEFENYYTSSTSNNAKFNQKSYKGIPCISFVFDPKYKVGDSFTVYFDADINDPNNTNKLPYAYINFKVTSIKTVSSPCKDTPEDNIFNGLSYQGKAANNSDCQTMYNDNGDGKGFQYLNDDLSGQCAGFCYYNLPDSIGGGNNGGDNGNGGNEGGNNSNNDEETNLSDLIPYLDEVEEKNQNIKDSLDTLNTNLNTQFNNINSNNTNLNTTMNNLDSTLNNINDTLTNMGSSNSNNPNSPDYTGVAGSLNINPNINSELDSFKSDIESSLESSFSSYSNVFGLSGYGSAPSPITFSVLGKTYTIFDIKYLNPYVDHIRNIFLVTAYIFGLFLVFKGN